MKHLILRFFPFCSLVILLAGCNSGRDIPDVSAVNVALETQRFENDFFAVDTLHLNNSLQSLSRKYPGFTQDFLFNILGSTPDSAVKDVPSFIRTYMDMYRSSQQTVRDFGPIAAQVKRGLQFAHYYFPAYKLPVKLVTFIGPINSYGNIITANSLAVGLQLYMGRNYPMYLSENGQQLYPQFISRRFEPAYIPVNCMKNIIDDMFPNNNMGRPLVEQMVEAGKRMYVLDHLLPELADSLKTGYTQKQLEGSYASEKNIWSFFVQNDLLFSTDPNTVRDYLTDAPNTQALGTESPGNIGQFVGTQIVIKWMEKNKKVSLQTLMQTPARRIFDEAKYKPS